MPSPEAEDGTVKLGLVAPMSGPNARYGAFSLRGAQMAAKEINGAGGIGGRKISVLAGDGQGTPVEGVSATRRLLDQDQVDFIIVGVSSSVTLAMQPVVEDAGVLLLNAASSNPKITYKAGVGGFKWTYRNYPTDENRVLIVLQYAAEKKGFSKYAVLSVDSDYGRAAIEFTKKYLPRFKSQILTEDYYKEGEVDFRSVLSKIRDSGAQAILRYGNADSSPIVGRQIVEVGIGGEIPLIGNAGFNTEKTIKAAPKALEGAIEASGLASRLRVGRKARRSSTSSLPSSVKPPTTTPMCTGRRRIFWPRRSSRPRASTARRSAPLCPRSIMRARSAR